MPTSRAPGRAAGKTLYHPALQDIGMEQVLRALGDPVRLGIVRALASAEAPMSCGAFGLSVSKSTSTYHFRVLRESGVISQFEEGTARYSELRAAEFEERFPGLLQAVLASR
ncbi:MAG: ArsR family transcriptional regulator [Actinoallomurus sp.]|jgi:DNA-binding transcriptional ArsR family regulator|nr:ArsR family transcriptional regulator [Actinoallomurus sp.]